MRARGMGAVADNVRNALFALRLNLLRSLLTMMGITVGMLAIVTLIAILQGVKTEIQKQVEGLGANLVMVLPSKLDENGMPNPMAMMGISALTDRDVNALKAIPGVAEIAPVLFVAGTVETTDAKKSVTGFVVGTNKQGVIMNPTPLAEGRYFEASELELNLCILGAKQKESLFGKASVVGKTVLISGKKWKVIGALSKPASDGTMGNAMMGLSDLVYLPEGAVRRDVKGWQMNRIVLKTDYNHPAEEIIGTLEEALRKAHNGKDNFGLVTQKRGLAMVIRLVNMAQSLLVLIAAISLFVAGVGIMNIMLVTVTERTREIGIRKTVGAKRKDIFLQFITEAITLSLMGGILGLVLSLFVCSMIARFSDLTPEITMPLVGMALAVCTTVGVLFGVAPAVRAARLNPIDALRYE